MASRPSSSRPARARWYPPVPERLSPGRTSPETSRTKYIRKPSARREGNGWCFPAGPAGPGPRRRQSPRPPASRKGKPAARPPGTGPGRPPPAGQGSAQRPPRTLKTPPGDSPAGEPAPPAGSRTSAGPVRFPGPRIGASGSIRRSPRSRDWADGSAGFLPDSGRRGGRTSSPGCWPSGAQRTPSQRAVGSEGGCSHWKTAGWTPSPVSRGQVPFFSYQTPTFP